MPESLWLEAVVTVGFGALAGGVTNWIAVRMLFHPYEPTRIGPVTLHGAIPKNKARLAKSIGRTVGQRLLTEDDLARQLSAPELREAFDRSVSELLARGFDRSWGSLRDELPPPILAEVEAAMEPLARLFAERLAAFAEGEGFDAAVERYVALDRWVEEGVRRPELETAVFRFLAAQRARLLADERPVIDRLPAGVLAALEHAIADYLPIAVERLGALMADPDARERVRGGLRRFLDHAIRNMMLHERLMAKLVITEKRIDRALAGLEGGGLAELTDVLEAPEFRAQVASAVNDAVVRFLQQPLADRLWALGPERLDGLERAIGEFVVGALRAPETRVWAVARARDALGLARAALAGAAGRERVTEGARATVKGLLARPIGRPADLLPPDAEARLRHAVTEPLWGWIQRQVPTVVSQLSVQEMVEQKVLGFSVRRMEEIIRNVTERELRTIVQLGYLLGAIVGLAAFAINRLIG